MVSFIPPVVSDFHIAHTASRLSDGTKRSLYRQRLDPGAASERERERERERQRERERDEEEIKLNTFPCVDETYRR